MSPQGGSRPGATGAHTTRGVPHGVTSLTPYVAVTDMAGAVDFYAEVLGARVVELTNAGEALVHAHLDLGDGHLHLEAAAPEHGLAAPPCDGADSLALGYYCEDVDAVLDRMQAAGGEVLAPAVDFASGDRFAALRDPFGIRWSVMSRVEDLSESQSAERVAAWAVRGCAAE